MKYSQMKKLFAALVFLMPLVLGAQILKPSKWSYEITNPNAKAGDEVELIFNVTIDKDWYLYSTDFDPDLGPVPTTFEFEKNNTYELIDSVRPINAKKKYDDLWGGEYTYFVGKAQFRQKVRILKDDFKISGFYDFQVCTDIDGKCIPGDGEFEVRGKTAKPVIEESSSTDDLEGKGFFGIILFGFFWGLWAVATPCIYPLIPITVSIFLKQSETKAEGLKKAFIYGFSIIVLFVVIGFLVSWIWGATALNELSTHWLFNIILFALFVAFGLSLFGLFEIRLPNAMVNAIDRKADKGGYIGIFFMAITLVVVSFSCTVPLVSTALIGALQDGELINGVAAMFGFSLAFALPFTAFAIFPSYLNDLPKSGGWLNSVKIILGFLELALAMKFLSVADLAYHWGILDRPIFLALWIVIFSMIGFYLLGKIKFKGDTDMANVSVPRVLIAILTFGFVVYLIPGLFGAPLKPLAGFLPPLHTNEFNLGSSQIGPTFTKFKESPCEVPKYGDILHAPHGIGAYFEYEQALQCARETRKPLFIDFTGHGCVNCREMEARVWSDPRVLSRLKNDFIVVELYVDDRTTLPESEWIKSKIDGKTKKTIGKKNADFQIERFGNNAQPYYVILDGNENILGKPKAYDLNVSNFVSFLDQAKEAYNKK